MTHDRKDNLSYQYEGSGAGALYALIGEVESEVRAEMNELNLFNELCITVLDEREAAEPIVMSCLVMMTPAEIKLYDIADDTTVNRALKILQAQRNQSRGNDEAD